MSANQTFMIVDDHASIRKVCVAVGKSLGFDCLEAETAEHALRAMESSPPEIVLADLRMPNMDGIEFLQQIKSRSPMSEVAIMTGHASVETAVQAMRLGAYDYIPKPFRIEQLKLLLERMRDKVVLLQENEFLKERVSSEMHLNGIIGSSKKIQDVLRMISKLKDTRTPVLVTGESGTGKELVARAIHYRGVNSERPFIAVDCGALVPSLIESELFGYEKGAFTGANRSKDGLFMAANGGTLFLDEIGELPLEMQAKLLRVLQEREVRPVGSNRSVKVDVRIVAATNRDLEVAYKQGSFRRDLFFRLNVVAVHLPSLRERRSDVPALLQWFFEKHVPGSAPHVSEAAMQAMLNYDWPGNVRELENCVERAIALGCGDRLGLTELPASIQMSAETGVENDWLDMFVDTATKREMDLEAIERITIQRAYEQTHGDKALTGKMLGISRATLYRKLKRYGISAQGHEKELAISQ